MIAGFIIELATGLICIIMGLLISIKKKISLIHSYHYKNVKDADIPVYAGMIGIGLIIIGIGICVTGVLNLSENNYWWLPLLIGIAAGLIIMNKAQKKFNGSWFG